MLNLPCESDECFKNCQSVHGHLLGGNEGEEGQRGREGEKGRGEKRVRGEEGEGGREEGIEERRAWRRGWKEERVEGGEG